MSKIELLSERQKSRAQIITAAFWAISEILAEQEEILRSTLRASFRTNEPADVRERLTARLCAIEDLDQAFRTHLPPVERSER